MIASSAKILLNVHHGFILFRLGSFVAMEVSDRHNQYQSQSPYQNPFVLRTYDLAESVGSREH